MTNLRDLVLEVEEAELTEAIARLYNRSETEWLPEAIANVLAQLRKLVPDPDGAVWQLRIELTPPIADIDAGRTKPLDEVINDA